MTPPPTFFLSYSRADGVQVAEYIFQTLKDFTPPVSFWMDRYSQIDGRLWDIQIRNAICDTLGLVFIMTPDSVEEQSGCYDEWTLALKYKKPIVPILTQEDIELPFRLHQRQYIDFSGDQEEAISRLHRHLIWMQSPQGELQRLKDQLADARRDMRRAKDKREKSRITGEIEQITGEIRTQTRVIQSPKFTEQNFSSRIQKGLEETRRASFHHQVSQKVVNIPPLVAPTYFQDRHVETALVGKFLLDRSVRMIVVMGRGGVGKTTMICRLLATVSEGRLPDDGGQIDVHGLVYLGERSSRRIRFSNLFDDVITLLPEQERNQLKKVYKNPKTSVETKVKELLTNFSKQNVIVLLDNFEDCLHPETNQILDEELAVALRTILNSPPHLLRVIITTRAVPYDLSLIQPAVQRRIDLDTGLPSPYAENILREMDFDGRVGLKEAPSELLTKVKELTRGYPRALEAFFAILSVDRETTLADLIQDMSSLLPENVIYALIGEAFNRLPPRQKAVMQALAVFNMPVPPIAIDFLLQPYVPAMESSLYLKQLVNMLFVRREGSKYYLHPLDRQYAFHQIPKGSSEDYQSTNPIFSQFGLLARAADYFSQISKPSTEWSNIEDIESQLAEFELRYLVMDYEKAFTILKEISVGERRGGWLFAWGHYRKMISLYERIQNKLSDWESQQICFTQLGYAYGEIGPLEIALEYLRRALVLSQQLKDSVAEANLLGWIASTYKEQGKYLQAINNHKKALKIALQLDDKEAISYNLGEAGFCYRELGEILQALKLYEQAVKYDRQSGNESDEGAALRNIGICHHWLGDTNKGLTYLQNSLNICHRHDSPRRLALTLSAMAHVHLSNADLLSAKQQAYEAIQIADGLGLIRVQNEARWIISLVHLLDSDFLAAKSYLEEARDMEYYRNSPNIFLLLGVTEILLQAEMLAVKAFREAIASASGLLSFANNNFRALNVQAISMCGLFLCNSKGNVEKAKAIFRRSWSISQAPAIFDEYYQIFRLLRQADDKNRLIEIEEAFSTQSKIWLETGRQ